MKNTTFKEDFFWGIALSNAQAEGTFEGDGKGDNVYDTMSSDVAAVDSKLGVGHYKYYKEDIQQLAELGIKAMRFAVVWSRIHPTGEDKEPNEAGLAFYEAVVDECLKHGIEPVASLVHFDMPETLAEKYNGFYSKKVVELFEEHVRVVVNRLKGKVKYWITYNEINTAYMGPGLVAGVKQPAANEAEHFLITTCNTQLAHARGVKAIREGDPNAIVGGMIAYTPFYPNSNNPKDIYLAEFANKCANYVQLDMMCHDKLPGYLINMAESNGLSFPLNQGEIKEIESAEIDYIAFSYYKSDVVNNKIAYGDIFASPLSCVTNTPKNPHVKATEWDWQIDPIGMRFVCADIYERYRKPIFIVENGIGLREELTADGKIHDDERVAYHTNHFREMENAVKYDGVDLMGYLAWTGFDILSSKKEMTKRYGFVYINRTNDELLDMKRIKKNSFSWYQEVIKNNGLSE